MATWSQGCPWKKKLTHMRGVSDVLNEMSTALEQVQSKSYVLTDVSAAIGTCQLKVSLAATDYTVNGIQYSKTAVANQALPACATVPTAKYGAFAWQIGSDGTVDGVAATANATGYSTAAAALAGLPAVSSNHARMATLVHYSGVCNFVPGTSKLSAHGATSAVATFADGQTLFEMIAATLTTSVPQTDI